MPVRKYRWSRDYESAEEELEHMLRKRRFKAERWIIEAGETLDLHAHNYDIQLWCAEGSIIFTAGGQSYSLQPGDALDIPANTIHSAIAGMTGAVCYESRTKPSIT